MRSRTTRSIEWLSDAARIVKPANSDECAQWEATLAEDNAEGIHEDRQDAVTSNGFAFLAEYREADE